LVTLPTSWERASLSWWFRFLIVVAATLQIVFTKHTNTGKIAHVETNDL